MAMELDAAALHYLFATLPGEALAACAQVCRAWRAVAESEVLWQRQVLALEPHHHLRRDDLLPEFGGSHRAYYAWRWPLLRRPLRRILVAADADWREEPDIRTLPAPGSSGAAVQVACEPFAFVQQATLAPAGPLLAFTEALEGGQGQVESRVVLADARTGARRCVVELAEPFPPFYFQWTPCGTRLIFLSNWHGQLVALQVLDAAAALLPPRSGGVPEPVLLCTARPLFLAASPTSTRLLWHGNCREWGLCDAATPVSEDGAEHDCFFANARDCRSQAPQWVVDGAGEEHLLMPVMDAEGDGGQLVLASLAKVSEAYEADGSRLSPSLLLALSQPVARFNFSRKLLFAANADASMVAWTDGGSLHIAFRETGAVHTLWQPAAPPGRGQQHHCLLRPPWVDRGFVLALHWSPDGRRLLFLLHAGPPPAAIVVTSAVKQPKFRWVVYDAPAAPPQAMTEVDAPPGWLGTLTACWAFNPTPEFLQRYLPFADQYLGHSLRLWDPAGSAFCFGARGHPAEGEVSEECSVFVQPLPPPGQAAGAAGSSSAAQQDEAAALHLAEAPPPVWLAPGDTAAWSWS